MVNTFNIIILGGLIYSFFLYLMYESIDDRVLSSKKSKLKLSLIFMCLAGLPPTPLFLIKMWFLGTLSGTVWAFGAIVLVLTNSALLYTYYTVFIDSIRNDPETDSLKQNRKKTPLIGVVILSIIAIFSPYILCIL